MARWIILVAALAALLAGRASAGSGLLIGVDDDTVKWPNRPAALTDATRALGLGAVRVTLAWRRGEARLGPDEGALLRQALWASGAARVVVAVYGKATEAPQDDAARTAYCSYLGSIAHNFPDIRDLVVWNEPNAIRFWKPQAGAPAAYEALLARCWDTLHALRPDVNVIAASAPRGTTPPGSWYGALGAAYRASGRTRPLFDTVGHNAYPNESVEEPTVQHPDSSLIAQGDYGRLMQALADAFGGTAQPPPGQGRVTIWYMEQGFQTAIEPGKAGLYRGAENVQVLRPANQGTQLASALRLAYCQPAVGALFNFQLADEPDLAGWQSGVLWADGTPKPGLAALQAAIADVKAGRVSCSAYGLPQPPPPASAPAPAPAPTPAPPPPAPAPEPSRGGGTTGVVTVQITPGG
jgi:hypothetical protein